MTDKIKQIPNVECLKYHGTNDKPDIKVFVSNRIDQDSITIDNPLYIPIRCGAVYDCRKNITMLGDNTGENISAMKPYLSEFTVQYWAWKNVKSDYYGICHYRRYLSFSEKKYKTDNYFNLVEKSINKFALEKYSLNEKFMREKIEHNDFICAAPIDVKLLPGKFKNVKDQFSNCVPYLFEKDINILEETIKDNFPEYYPAAKKYLYGTKAFFCNLFIMKKELFFEYNDWLFKILKILFNKIDMSNYSKEGKRTLGHLGERLFGIYITHIQSTRKLRYNYLQPIFFCETEKIQYPKPSFKENNIAITLASSNEYVPYLSVALSSIIQNSNKKYNYDIVILSNKISSENKYILRTSFTRKNIELRFLEITNYLEQQNLYIWGHITKMTYTRLACLDIFRNYKKVIYLDADTIVNKDLSELFSLDIKNYYIAAARDTVMAGWINGLNKIENDYAESLGLNNLKNYFNAGVMLINLEKFSSYITSQELFNLASKKKYRWGDQDILNKVCEGKVYFLGNKWNFITHFYNNENELSEFYAPENIFNDYKESDKDPYIIHYAGNVLPTFVPTVNHSFDFWKYAKQTPFYEYLVTVHSHTLALSIWNNEKRIQRLEKILFIPFILKFKNKIFRR